MQRARAKLNVDWVGLFPSCTSTTRSSPLRPLLARFSSCKHAKFPISGGIHPASEREDGVEGMWDRFGLSIHHSVVWNSTIATLEGVTPGLEAGLTHQ